MLISPEEAELFFALYTSVMDFGPRIHRLSDHSHLDFPVLMLFDVRCVAIVKIPVNGY